MSDKQPSDAKSSPAKLRMVSNERGAVLALVALLLVVFLGLAALAIDLGLLYVARGEAQRAADAAAHAGAGYLLNNPDATEAEIKAEAMRVGQRNLVRGEWADIDPDQDIDILRDERKVRVRVHRTNDRENPVGTLFAQIIGFGLVDVAASAAAEIWPADAGTCVWPFALPDRWCTEEAQANGTCPADQYSDALESAQGWEDGDWYTSWRDDDHLIVDGKKYWTGYSDEDYGDQLLIKSQDPSGAIQPGWYFPFEVGTGGSGYRDAISGCDFAEEVFAVGDTLHTEPGNMVGPTRQGFEELKRKYPDARWDSECNCPKGEDIDGRTRPIVLFNPEFPPDQGRKPFVIEGFAAAFFDDFDSDGNVRVYFVELTGATPAPTRNIGGADPQMKILRIVE